LIYFVSLSRRHWQDKAASADAKLQTLNAQFGEVRERFKQAQREIETHEVRINLCLGLYILIDVFSVNAEIFIGDWVT